MEREKIHAELNEIFRNVFDDETLMITEEMCADDIEDWDSLAQIDLITASEGVFNTKFSLSEILPLENIGDMIDLVDRKINL